MQLFWNPLHYSLQAKPSCFESKRDLLFLYFCVGFQKQIKIIWLQNFSLHSCGSCSVHTAASCSCVFVVVKSHPKFKWLPVITFCLKKQWKCVLCYWTRKKPCIGFFLYDGLFVAMCHKCLNMFLVASISLSYFERLWTRIRVRSIRSDVQICARTQLITSSQATFWFWIQEQHLDRTVLVALFFNRLF